MRVVLAARWAATGGMRTFLGYVYSQPAFADCDFVLVQQGESVQTYLDSMIPDSRIRVVLAPSSLPRLGLTLRRELSRHRPHLLHSHGFTAGGVSELARTGCRVPHLMTAHEALVPEHFRGLSGRIRRGALDLAFRRINHVHTATEDAAGNFLEYFPSANRSRVTPILHGVDALRFRNAAARDVHAEIGLPPEVALIGFFGRFMPAKGFRDLVDAAAILVQEGSCRPFRVITFGWNAYIREDYDYIRQRGLERYFIQQAHTDQPECWITGVDVVAMPSRWEACGLLAMETLAAGVPIVGTDCVGLREVLEGSPAVPVPSANPEALARALYREIQSPRRSTFEHYSPTAVARFGIERPAKALRALYDQLALT